MLYSRQRKTISDTTRGDLHLAMLSLCASGMTLPFVPSRWLYSSISELRELMASEKVFCSIPSTCR